MSAASIAFTDGTGAATLSNGLGSVADGAASHFTAWTPENRPNGAKRWALGTGAMYFFRFRTDYVAKFELREIPVTSLDVALRLQEWLRRGNTCAVTTGDTSARVYSNCCLAEGSDVEISQADPIEQTFTMRFVLVNLSAAAMLCTYE